MSQFTTLSSGGNILVLPAAEFDNSYGNLSSVKIQRSMIGDVYSTVKRAVTITLKLHFELERSDLLQLQSFLLQHATDLITLDDWNSRRYIGYFYNETFESTENQQWLNSIDMLFEGRQLI